MKLTHNERGDFMKRCKTRKDHAFKAIEDGTNEMYQVYECGCGHRKMELKKQYRKAI